MNLLQTPDQVHAFLEQLFLRLDQQAEDSVKTVANNYLAGEKHTFAGSAYLDQIEKNAIYLCETAKIINGKSAHYLCVGEPLLPPGGAGGGLGPGDLPLARSWLKR